MKIRHILTTAAALLVAGATSTSAQQKQLSIATGGTGGVYYPLGGGFANIIAKELPGYTATAEVTGGSVDNLKLIGTGKSDIAFVQVDASWDAINGKDKFPTKLPVQALVVMYPNHMHVVTVDGTGIAKIEDLKGKRMSIGSPGSATEVFCRRVLEAAGLDADKDIKKERLGVAESVNAIKDKKVDAFCWVGGLPTAAVTDLAATPNTKLKMIDFANLADKMNAKYGPLYSATTIPKTTYTGMDADNQNIAVWNLMAVNESMSDELAYNLTKIMLEKREDLGRVHKEGLGIKAELQSKARAGIPFHKGALKYYAEKGIKLD